MLLGRVAEQLGWPEPEAILAPAGAGPAILAETVQRKIGVALADGPSGATPARIGVLTGDPESDASEAPLAIVCEFEHVVSDAVLERLHTLAWNFARSPLLITIEPTRVRSWSCFEAPKRAAAGARSAHAEIPSAGGPLSPDGSLASEVARALDWVILASGEFLRIHQRHFPRDRRADRTLLENLREVRQRLVYPQDGAEPLDADVAHDLLARLIFIQFLFQRRDSSGTPALTPAVLRRLHRDGRLRREYTSLDEILRSHRDSYALFRWLNTHFNGDLFPAKADTESERDRQWAAEERVVRAEHLRLLADFVSGSLVLASGQLSLWPLYSFDTIPLEFISSVYEEFVHQSADEDGTTTGAHYTPLHLVDFVLDAVLPWNGEAWDLTILDPACGSGVFLVKVFQRLVHRWKRAHPGQRITAEVLRRLLEQNLVGIDLDPHAVRVASFSLYLAMCDEIDPRDYWKQVRFPILRGRRLLASDFFREDVEGIRSVEDEGSFDLVVGNAPWGHTSASADARRWAREHDWPVANKDVGPLFLIKAARLARPGAPVALLQPAGLLLNRYGPAEAFRQKLFSTFKVDEVVNFSALRRQLFTKSAAPTCCVVLRNSPQDGEPLRYVCPKPTRTGEDQYRIAIDAHDVHDVYPEEAAADPWVWTVFMWGGRRDYALVHDLQRLPTLAKLRDSGIVHAGAGLEWGDRQGAVVPEMKNRRVLASPTLPEDTFIHLDISQLEVRDEVRVHSRSPTDLRIYRAPQLIMKRSWMAGDRRFRAALVLQGEGGSDDGVLCTQSYVSVSATPEHQGALAAAFLAFSSGLSVYHTLMTSGRMASYRPEALVSEILDMPLPPVPSAVAATTLLGDLHSWAEVEARAQEAYDLPAAHRALVEDVVRYTLPNFKEDARGPGWRPTQRRAHGSGGTQEPELRAYCDYFLRVLRGGFAARDVCATIYQDDEGSRLPVRLVALHLDWPGYDQDIRVTPLASHELRQRLLALDTQLRRSPHAGGSVFYQRVARVYDTVKVGRRRVPTVFIVKPDRARYWTRSMAMRDADEVVVESGVWERTASGTREAMEPMRA